MRTRQGCKRISDKTKHSIAAIFYKAKIDIKGRKINMKRNVFKSLAAVLAIVMTVSGCEMNHEIDTSTTVSDSTDAAVTASPLKRRSYPSLKRSQRSKAIRLKS